MSDPLHGPRAKIERAKSQLMLLDKAQQRFFKHNSYEVGIADFDQQRGHHSLRVVSGPESLPDEWAAIIGEIAHDLRSALDGLAWQLALLSTSDPFDFTGFPVLRVKRGQTRSQVWRNAEIGAIQSIDRRLWTRIEAFQPYKRGNGGRRSPLFLVHELNRVDKHRLIPVAAAAMGGVQISGLSGGTRPYMRVQLRPNAKVGYVLPLPSGGAQASDLRTGRISTVTEVQVETTVTPYVRFGRGCDAVKGLPVNRTLMRGADEVSRVVEAFAPEFE